MKTLCALLIAALFTTAACKGKDAAKTEPAKTDPAAKPTEPPKADPATPDPAKADPAKADPAKVEPPKTEPPKTEPAAAPVTVEQAGAKLNDLVDKVVKATTDAGNDCAKLGTALKALIEDAKAVSAQDKEIEKDPAKQKEFEAKYEKAADAKTKAPMKKVEKCMTNADVKAFTDALAGK